VFRAVIIGQGNIGQRHAESLLKSEHAQLELRDTYEILQSSKKFYENIKTSHPEARYKFISKEKTFNQKYDLAIIATDSNRRFEALMEFLTTSSAEYIILEKPITNSIYELNQMKKFISKNDKFFVNLPREIMQLFQKTKEIIQKDGDEVISMKVEGGKLGLASNLIHFLRIAEFFTGQSIRKIYQKENLHMVESKRKNYFELIGGIFASTESGICVEINSFDKIMATNITIKSKRNHVKIIENSGKVFVNNKFLFTYPLERQSDLTLPSFVRMKKNKKSLPTFHETFELHLLILEFLNKTEL
jgi:predicted dehydrogenase